ncbi:hypothetical protein BKA70DRAFT_1235620 [Coprinopsis sp. MPI-PUGE-AT-0042]|nr:hypothetical protein BKA70DRAFT_1235620 [Coprinopsis sp. MPI-PUGE-AT-0042]
MAQYTKRKDIFEAVNYAVVTHLLLCLTDERLSCNATFSVFGLVTCGSREHGTKRGIGPDRAQPRGSALESREFVIKTEVGLGDAGSGSNSDSALGFWMEVGSQDLGKVNNTPIIESFKGYLHLPEHLTWGSVLRLTTHDLRESGTES